MAIWRALCSQRRTKSETDKGRQVQMLFLNLELAFQKHPLCVLHCFTNKRKKLYHCINIYGNLCLLFLRMCVYERHEGTAAQKISDQQDKKINLHMWAQTHSLPFWV